MNDFVDTDLENLISHQWGFAQIMVALESAKKSNQEDFEIFIPEIEREKKTMHVKFSKEDIKSR